MPGVSKQDIVFEHFSEPIFLIGYDVESNTAPSQFLPAMLKVHTELECPTTFFIKGQTLVQFKKQFVSLQGNPLIDLQQHTFTHVIFKALTCFKQEGQAGIVVQAENVPLDVVEGEVGETSDLFEEVGLRRPTGLTTPYAFYRGLLDNPEITDILWRCGIRFVRSWGRNERGYNPNPMDVQPFWYSKNGHTKPILECCLHFWQDCILLDTLGYNQEKFVEMMTREIEHFYRAGRVFSWCRHDWACIQNDHKMESTRIILKRARDLGFRIMHYRDFYELAKKNL